MFTAASASAEAVVFSRLLGIASPSEVSSIGPICSSTNRFMCESELIWVRLSHTRRYSLVRRPQGRTAQLALSLTPQTPPVSRFQSGFLGFLGVTRRRCHDGERRSGELSYTNREKDGILEGVAGRSLRLASQIRDSKVTPCPSHDSIDEPSSVPPVLPSRCHFWTR